ncbi:hypothetical protein Taro_048824 [Colocasia esculenta]|uniref:Uncharacterized protein n=1 Tax=Colocasia esculenta TaxID=4460 RepID=A0A843X961_COLES|nr:hypothetical protein [Colocasia esculenta]
MPFAFPLTSLMRFIGIDIPDSECITLNSRSSFDLTVAHRMGYKLIDGVVTRVISQKTQSSENIHLSIDAKSTVDRSHRPELPDICLLHNCSYLSTDANRLSTDFTEPKF